MSNQRRCTHQFTCAGCVKHSKCQQGGSTTLAGVRRPRTDRTKSTCCLRFISLNSLTQLDIMNSGIPWRRLFLSLASYLNLVMIVCIWISARYPTGSFAVFFRNWAPDVLHTAWGNACFACRGSLKTYLKISAPDSFCLEILHGFLMVVFVVLG